MKTTSILVALIIMACEGFSQGQPPPLDEIIRLQRAIKVPHQVENFTRLSDARVIRVEPDGIHVRHAGGIAKLFASDLPKDVREKYHLYSEYAQWSMQRQEAAAATVKQERWVPVPQTRSRERADASGKMEAEKPMFAAAYNDPFGARGITDPFAVPDAASESDPFSTREIEDPFASYEAGRKLAQQFIAQRQGRPEQPFPTTATIVSQALEEHRERQLRDAPQQPRINPGTTLGRWEGQGGTTTQVFYAPAEWVLEWDVKGERILNRGEFAVRVIAQSGLLDPFGRELPHLGETVISEGDLGNRSGKTHVRISGRVYIEVWVAERLREWTLRARAAD